jgi:hypothetical protein
LTLLVLKLIGAVGALLVFGYSLLAWIAPRTTLNRFERFGIAYVLGTGAASILWILLAPLYGVVSPKWALSGIIGAVALVAMWRRAAPPPDNGGPGDLPEPADRPRTWMLVACSAVIALELGALVFASARTELGFDAVFNFELKARLAFENETRGQLPLAYFADASRVWSHPRYPLLVPFAEFWVYEWLGRVDQHLVKFLFPMYYVALAVMVGGAIQRRTGTEGALAAVVAMGTLPSLMVIPGAISGYAEVPLAAAIAAAISCCFLGIRTGRAETFWLAGALSAIAAWTKVEGGVLALCLGIAGLLGGGRRAAPMLMVPLAIMLPWSLFQQSYGFAEKDFPSLTPQVAIANLDRMPLIVGLVARELVTPGHWGLIWPAFGAACVLAAWQRRWSLEDAMLASVVIVPLFAYAFAYLFSSWPDVGNHIRTSFGRLLVPLAPTAIIFTAARLWEGRREPGAPASVAAQTTFTS